LADNDPYYYYDYDYDYDDGDYYDDEEYYPEDDEEPAVIIINGKNVDGTDAEQAPAEAATPAAPAVEVAA
jgi:hypothetical protein